MNCHRGGAYAAPRISAGGWSTIFTLESGFNTKAGTLNQGGRLFGRQAYVGLKGPYGSLTFGPSVHHDVLGHPRL